MRRTKNRQIASIIIGIVVILSVAVGLVLVLLKSRETRREGQEGQVAEGRLASTAGLSLEPLVKPLRLTTGDEEEIAAADRLSYNSNEIGRETPKLSLARPLKDSATEEAAEELATKEVPSGDMRGELPELPEEVEEVEEERIAFDQLLPTLGAEAICKDVAAKEPVDETTIFQSTDEKVVSWVKFAYEAQKPFLVEWNWYDPSGALYRTATVHFEKGIYKGYRTWHWIAIKTAKVSSLAGGWKVEVAVDGHPLTAQYFEIK